MYSDSFPRCGAVHSPECVDRFARCGGVGSPRCGDSLLVVVVIVPSGVVTVLLGVVVLFLLGPAPRPG